VQTLPARPVLVEHAPAKINLTLEVHGRRVDGYHELTSLVAFASAGDRLALVADKPPGLRVTGPFASAAGNGDANLVLKAASALAARVDGLVLGRFLLQKRLPVAAGIGGGSSDAAAALRLLARLNRLDQADPRLVAAARVCGADVPVCLDPKPRVMAGIGELLSSPIALTPLPVVLVNPGVPVVTREVFGALAAPPLDRPGPGLTIDVPTSAGELLEFLRSRPNDLEGIAVRLAPVVATALESLRGAPGCEFARMSGSGGTCFGVFRSGRSALAAARALRAARPGWWVRPTMLGEAQTA
jgi:4-diphosphocytidyl-2-C-methyl-D-erythritol kinase